MSQSGTTVTIRQNGELTSFVGGDGQHEYVAIDLDTGLDTIVGARWGSYTMTQSDVDDATAVGLPAGHIVYYAECDQLSTPRTITISKDGYSSYSFVVQFVPMA